MDLPSEKQLNIVVPMAGRGSRFAQAGFLKPKPLIPLGGIPMIQWVIRNVRPNRRHRFIFVCLKEHLVANPDVPQTLIRLCPGCEIVGVDQVTEGAACTVLLAREHIDNESPLMIANSDQFVDLPIDRYLVAMDDPGVGGLIMTFWADHPKWSYCRMRADGTVAEVVEKKVISREATVGLYNFSHGRDFVWSAEEMIRRNLRTNNEFYVAPTYNILIERGYKVVVRQTGREYAGMYGLGTPEDYEFFQTTAAFRRRCPREYISPYSSETLRLKKRTEIGIRFFNDRNRAGIEALLHPNVILTSGSGCVSGRAAVVDRFEMLFVKNARCELQLANALTAANTTAVRFEGRGGDMNLSSLSNLTWEDDLIRGIDSSY